MVQDPSIYAKKYNFKYNFNFEEVTIIHQMYHLFIFMFGLLLWQELDRHCADWRYLGCLGYLGSQLQKKKANNILSKLWMKSLTFSTFKCRRYRMKSVTSSYLHSCACTDNNVYSILVTLLGSSLHCGKDILNCQTLTMG